MKNRFYVCKPDLLYVYSIARGNCISFNFIIILQNMIIFYKKHDHSFTNLLNNYNSFSGFVTDAFFSSKASLSITTPLGMVTHKKRENRGVFDHFSRKYVERTEGGICLLYSTGSFWKSLQIV